MLYICAIAYEGHTLNITPSSNQLYPLDANNTAIVTISGTLTNNNYVSDAQIKVWRKKSTENLYLNISNYSITSPAFNNTSSFTFNITIDAGLQEYKFEIYYKYNQGQSNLTTLIAENVVCGDAYIIEGQSNAVACGIDKDEAIRAKFDYENFSQFSKTYYNS